MSTFPFSLNSIDHVAIRSADMDRSVAWYSKVLGLTKVQPKEWQPFPIFMMNKYFGVAIFPIKMEDDQPPKADKLIDHFAHNVDNENLKKAQNYFTEIGIAFNFQDHHYYYSIYIQDPDGNKVELTTMIKDLTP